MRRTIASVIIATFIAGCSDPRVSEFRKPSPASPSPPVKASPEATLRFAAVGDIGNGSENEATVARAIAAEHSRDRLDLLLLLGDLLYDRGDPATYREKFATPYRPVLDGGIPTRAVLGNHDILTNGQGVIAAFGMPGRYYTFTRGTTQFFALDSSRESIDREQRGWLDKELARSTAPWKIAFMHHPMYSSGIRGSTLPVRDALEEMLVRSGVALVLAGHDHNYERTKPIRGIVHVVAGGGCCPRPGPLRANSFTAFFTTGLNFVTVEVFASSMQIRLINVEGKILDSARVRAPLIEEAA